MDCPIAALLSATIGLSIPLVSGFPQKIEVFMSEPLPKLESQQVLELEEKELKVKESHCVDTTFFAGMDCIFSCFSLVALSFLSKLLGPFAASYLSLCFVVLSFVIALVVLVFAKSVVIDRIPRLRPAIERLADNTSIFVLLFTAISVLIYEISLGSIAGIFWCSAHLFLMIAFAKACWAQTYQKQVVEYAKQQVKEEIEQLMDQLIHSDVN